MDIFLHIPRSPAIYPAGFLLRFRLVRLAAACRLCIAITSYCVLYPRLQERPYPGPATPPPGRQGPGGGGSAWPDGARWPSSRARLSSRAGTGQATERDDSEPRRPVQRPGAGSAAARAVAPASKAWGAVVAATSLQMEGRAEMGRAEGGCD